MRLMDIHAHILPLVDDGAKDVQASLELLEMMHRQGITHVIATPHFYAVHDGLEDYREAVSQSIAELSAAVAGKTVPQVGLGSEVLYFSGIGRSNGLRDLTLCLSDYLLLELPFCKLDADIVRDVRDISDRLGLIPILAHLERYVKAPGFKQILPLIEEGTVLAQVNAASLVTAPYKVVAHKLIKRGYVSFLGTDAHSPDRRPPMMDAALKEIETSIGRKTAERLQRNADRFCEEIFKPCGVNA